MNSTKQAFFGIRQYILKCGFVRCCCPVLLLLLLCGCLSQTTTEQKQADSPEQMYEQGLQYGKDLRSNISEGGEQAVDWLKKSAVEGYLPAVHALGWIYFEGRGVEKNLSRAEKYFRRAALQGYGESQYMLGLFYAQGWSVQKSSAISLQWMKKAAGQGHVGAQKLLKKLFKSPSSAGS